MKTWHQGLQLEGTFIISANISYKSQRNYIYSISSGNKGVKYPRQCITSIPDEKGSRHSEPSRSGHEVSQEIAVLGTFLCLCQIRERAYG